MKQHPINQLLNISLDNVVRMVDSGKIVGQPIYLGENRMIIPISRVTFGFGVGGSEFEGNSATKKKSFFDSESSDELFPFGGGSGGGVSINPMAFIVVDNNNVNVIYSKRNDDIYGRVFDFFEDLIIRKYKKEN